MSASKNYVDRVIIFECDDTFEADGLDFHDAYEEYKDNGGIARNVGDECEHRCRDCR